MTPLYKPYTGVGSRSTPDNILSLMADVAFKLSQEGYTLRSGGAQGADTAFEEGASNSFSECVPEIYIPWQGFGNRGADAICLKDLMNAGEAKKIASKIHPAWDKCSQGAKALHTRNIYQVLGMDLDSPSLFLLCYSRPDGDSVSGGTRTAWEVAKKYNVTSFNLYFKETQTRIQKWLDI